MVNDQHSLSELERDYHMAIMLPKVQQRFKRISEQLDALKLELNKDKSPNILPQPAN